LLEKEFVNLKQFYIELQLKFEKEIEKNRILNQICESYFHLVDEKIQDISQENQN
jgi:hypothetical protein